MKINRSGKSVDISYLKDLTISELEIEATHIEGIEILNGKSSLTKLTLIDCDKTDFTKLKKLPSLTELSLFGNFSSIEFIKNYKNIEVLILECGWKSLSGIEKLKKLSFLEISGGPSIITVPAETYIPGGINSKGIVDRNSSFKFINSLKLKELRFFRFSFNSELLLSLFEAIESGAIEKASIDKCYNLYSENKRNAYEFDISQSLITKFKNLTKVVDVFHYQDNYFGDSLEITCK